MRKSIVVTISLLFVAASAFAQQPVGSNAISVFVTDGEISKSSNGTRFGTDFGAALEHRFSSRLSAELSVTSQRANQFVTTLTPAGFPTTTTHLGRIYPIDANVSYHFFNESRWKPYLGAGLRYVSDTVRATTNTGNYRFSTSMTEPEVSGGITFQFTPRLGLRFDAKQVLGGDHPIIADPLFKASVGLSLRF
jgi:outer membrane protein W